MQRLIIVVLFISLAFGLVSAQVSISSTVEIVTVHSQNGKFYLKSTPFDNESPSLPGVTHVFAVGSTTPIYTVPRAFDSVEAESNNLVLSDDGETIFYLISYGAEEERDGLKSVSFYRRGELVKSYTASEITGCDLKRERCELEYSNYDEVVDRVKSNWGSPRYKKAFKAGVSLEERFLSDFAIFSSGNTVYLTDSKKQVHRFDLAAAKHVDTRPFAEVFEEIKPLGRFVKVELQSVNAPMRTDLPPLRTGVSAKQALAKSLGMSPFNIYGPDEKLYKRYGLTVHGYLKRDGSFEPTEIENWGELPKEKIDAFFASARFVTASIPKPMDRWLLNDVHFFFRKTDPKVAAQEKKEELAAGREAYEKRLVAETIDGRYIPKDLIDAFGQLDKELSEIDRREMSALAKRDDMIKYHHGLGTWIRNNWGLWSGSRLKKYFLDRRIVHPDDMSGVILHFYWDWLKGDKEAGKAWENDPKSLY